MLPFCGLPCPLLILVVNYHNLVDQGYVGNIKDRISVRPARLEVNEAEFICRYGVGEEGGDVSIFGWSEADCARAIYGESSSANESGKFTANDLPKIS